MKKILTILFIALFANAGVEEKKIIGKIIPPDPEYLWIEETREGKVSGQWEISEEILTNVQPILIAYIKELGGANKKSRFNKLYDELASYRCQYYGIKVNDSFQIFCNFFRFDATNFTDVCPLPHPSKWKECEYPIGLSAAGGGLAFFHFVYDVNEGKCKGFSFKGP